MAALIASTAAQAQTFVFSGHLDDGGVPANGSFTVGLAITDGDATLWSEEQPGVVVVDGAFAIDVGAAVPITISAPLSAALVLTVDGDELPPAPLSRLPRVLFAPTAGRTENSVQDADAIAGVSLADALKVSDLASGGAPYPFAAVTDVPADLADGDNGRDLTLAANSGLVINQRTLALGSVPGSKLATGSINAAATGTDVFNSANIADGAITGDKVRNGTLTRSALAADVTAAQTAVIPVRQVTATNCTISAGSLTTLALCPKKKGSCPGNTFEGCDSATCAADSFNNLCVNAELGNLVQP